MVDIHHDGVCDAPLDVAFAYLDDYRNAPTWMFGLSRFEPAAGRPDQGLGSAFDATFAVKAVKIKSTIEVTEWVRDEVIAFHSIDGFTNWSTWRFAADGPERTRISVVFSYELPGGLAGKALGRMLEPVIALTVRDSDKALRRNVAEHYAQTRG
jgi:uncharacterized membrane protein